MWNNVFCILSCVILVVIGSTIAQLQFECPPNETIAPCTCAVIGWGPQKSIHCGYSATQDDLVNSFNKLREYNGIGLDEFLGMPSQSRFALSYSSLTTLDLNFLSNVRIDNIGIEFNEEMTTAIGPIDPEEPYIQAKSLYLKFTKMTYEDFGEILKHFDPTRLNSLTIHTDSTESKSIDMQEDEFLPGLSKFTELSGISFVTNSSLKVGGGQFTLNNRMLVLGLQSPDLVIDADAFTFDSIDDEDDPIRYRQLTMELRFNGLTDASLNMKESGILLSSRPVYFNLGYNNIETLSQENIETFLNNNPQSRLSLENNPLTCDARLKWLKDGQEKYQHMIVAPDCSNDPGKTIWTSSLIF